MKREIKFRIWDATNKKFWFVDYKDILYGQRDFCTYPYEKCDSILLQQYTGLQDKNGKDIYEGDILKTEFHFRKKKWNGAFYSDGFSLGELEKFTCFEEVKWGIANNEYGSMAGWIVGDEGSLLDSLEWPNSCYDTAYRQDVFRSVEVAGNVFENPFY